MKYPTQKRLKELFDYNELTGYLIRTKSVSHNALTGEIIGCERPNGYLVAQVDNLIYRVHRLIWIYKTGINPIGDIDHIDGIRDNNKWNNMRSVTRMENSKNTKKSKRNKSGLAGVRIRIDTQKWSVEVKSNGQRFRLGCYPTIFEAACARISFNNKNGFSQRHGR